MAEMGATGSGGDNRRVADHSRTVWIDCGSSLRRMIKPKSQRCMYQMTLCWGSCTTSKTSCLIGSDIELKKALTLRQHCAGLQRAANNLAFYSQELASSYTDSNAVKSLQELNNIIYQLKGC